jgi:hypothetical protein
MGKSIQDERAHGKEPRGNSAHERPSAEVAEVIQVTIEFRKMDFTRRRMGSEMDWPAAGPLSD